MGNNPQRSATDAEFMNAVSEMRRKSMGASQIQINSSLEQRYRTRMLDTLAKYELAAQLKLILQDTIKNKMKKEDLALTVTVLKNIKSEALENSPKSQSLNSGKAKTVKNVVVRFDKKPKRWKIKQQNPESREFIFLQKQEHSLQGRVNLVKGFVKKQLNKPYHPFRMLCRKFGDFLKHHFQSELSSNSQKQYESKRMRIKKLIKDFADYVTAGCLGLYKRWIIDFSKIEQKHYSKFISSVIMNQMWVVNESHTLNCLCSALRRIRIPLRLNTSNMSVLSSLGLLPPKQFSISAQLQLEGNYFLSVYHMSHLTEQKGPVEMLKQIELLKNCICTDVDNYYKLGESEKICEINGDNMVGIVSFVLCKVGQKIEQIANILLFLELIYGDTIYYTMDCVSYMYSTLVGAIEYLESRTFQLPKEDSRIEKELKDTHCASSFVSRDSNNIEI